jgi:hypothetical protein
MFILDEREIDSIPRPGGLSQKNLRASMGLDKTDEAIQYYNRIRVSILVRPLN